MVGTCESQAVGNSLYFLSEHSTLSDARQIFCRKADSRQYRPIDMSHVGSTSTW